MLFDAEVIHHYGREQAVEDGVLIDVTDLAREAGITSPVAVTANLWASYIDCGDTKGRLWDVLWMFRIKARNTDSDKLTFSVSFTDEHGKSKLVKLLATCGPGDLGEAVITIMLPEDY
jgi:hypothetical protein